MLDQDNYPDEESLKRITAWDITTQPVEGLLDLIAENTNWADRQIERRGKEGYLLRLSHRRLEWERGCYRGS